MIQTAVTNNTLVEKNLDSENDVVMAEVSGLNDVSVQVMALPGIEIFPAAGEKLVITKINNSDSYMVAIAGVNEKIAPDGNSGERRIYSVDESGETIAAVASFKNDGTIVLNNGTQSVARVDDSVKTTPRPDEIQNLATDLLATGAFTPSGATPIPPTVVTSSFEDGVITTGNDSIKG